MTVAEWEALRKIDEVYNRETGYKQGGRFRELLWRKTVARKHLRGTLEELLVMARAWRQEYGMCGKGIGLKEVAES